MIVTAQHLQEGRKYNELTDRSGVAPFSVREVTSPGRRCPGMMHIKTTRGDWCVSGEQEFVTR